MQLGSLRVVAGESIEYNVGVEGDIPVALKELSIVFSVKLATQAFQNREEKSPFLIESHP